MTYQPMRQHFSASCLFRFRTWFPSGLSLGLSLGLPPFPVLGVLLAALVVSGCESSALPGVLQGDTVVVPETTRPPAARKTKKQIKEPVKKILKPAVEVMAGSAPQAFPRLSHRPTPAAAQPKAEPVQKPPSLVPFLTGQAQAQAQAEAQAVQQQAALVQPAQEASQPARPPLPPMRTPEGVRAALLLPLSGPNGELGKAMADAAQLALFDFADRNFELLVFDTRGTPSGAARAATDAIGEGASVILGPLLSASVQAVALSARAANVTVIAFSSDRGVTGEGVYTIGFYPGNEVRRVATYARSKGIYRFAALAPDNPYGNAVVDALRAAVETTGGTVTRVQLFDPGTTDYSDAVRQLADYDQRRQALLAQTADLKERDDDISKRALERLERLQTIGELPFDALLVAGGGKRLQAIAALLPFYDIDPSKVRMLGTGQWDEPALWTEPALIGGWFAAPAPVNRGHFKNQYRKAYGRPPPRLATLAYDATALASVLSKSGGDFGVETLTTKSGFDGRDGIFRFLESGASERGLAVLQVKPRGVRVISPAPKTF